MCLRKEQHGYRHRGINESAFGEESVASIRLVITEHGCRIVGMILIQLGPVVPLILTFVSSAVSLKQAGSTSQGYLWKGGGTF